MSTTFAQRVRISGKAPLLIWLIAGIIFCAAVRGPGAISLWVIWGTGVFIVGWFVLALPLVALGDRVLHFPPVVLICAAGSIGGLLMLSPNLLARLVDRQVPYAPFGLRDLAWPAIAFCVASVSTALYRIFLARL